MTTLKQLIEKDGRWYGGVRPEIIVFPWGEPSWWMDNPDSDFTWVYSVDPAAVEKGEKKC